MTLATYGRSAVTSLTRRPGTLPPPELTEPFPELASAAAELERLRADARAVRVELDKQPSARRNAEHADISAAASARRAGKPDPGSPGMAAVEARTAELERQSAILSAAIAAAETDLVDVVAAHRAAWSAKVRADVARQRIALRKAAEKWGELRHSVAALESLSRYLANFPDRPSYTSPNLGMAARLGRDAGMPFTTVLDALLADAEGPRADEPTDEAA